VISAGDVSLVCTSNGVDEAHSRVPSPRAPRFFGVHKKVGTVLWRCAAPGAATLHGQWSSSVLPVIVESTSRTRHSSATRPVVFTRRRDPPGRSLSRTRS